MQIVLIGVTGSGKSTVAQGLSEKLEIPHISSGAIARRLAQEDPRTELKLSAGLLAPEEAMRALVRDELERATLDRGGYVLEGFPRTVAQLIALFSWIKGETPTFFHIYVPPLVAIERLTDRGRRDDNPDAIERKLEDFKTDTAPVIEILEESACIHEIPNVNAPSHAIEHALSLLR